MRTNTLAAPRGGTTAKPATTPAPAQAPAKAPAAPLAKRRTPLTIIEPARKTLTGLLPEGANIDRFIRSAAFACARNPRIAECSDASIIEAVATAAELNLDFAPSLGQAYLVPYAGKVQFQLGYRGLITLAVRSATVRAIEAQVVHQNDTFAHQMGTAGYIRHERPPLGQDRGPIVGAYAVATLPGGVQQFDVMDIHELHRIRERSQSFIYAESKGNKDSVWHTDEAEMCKKTVAKRLCKYLSLSPEVGRALDADNEDFTPVAEPGARASNTQTLADRLGLNAPAQASEPVDEPPPDDQDVVDRDIGF